MTMFESQTESEIYFCLHLKDSSQGRTVRYGGLSLQLICINKTNNVSLHKIYLAN